jgi:hypothetical protein
MEIVTALLDFLRLASAVGLGVFVAEGSLALLMVVRGVRARRKKIAKLKTFEEEFVKKGKLSDENLNEAAEAILKGLGG